MTLLAEIAVVGSGRMAEAHLSALCALGIAPQSVVVISKNGARAEALAGRYGAKHRIDFAETHAAIVAVTPERTPATCRELVAAGVRSLLVEKPGALSSAALRELATDIERSGATAFMALNRRFLPSVMRARELIAADGGAVAFNFEFTDLEKHIVALRAEGVWPEINFSRWGFINPVHVIDLAFFLCGPPVEVVAKRAGQLSWHAAGSEFCGTGQVKSGALFSYWATFSGAGRWRIDITTRHRRLVLAPLETLHVQSRDSFELTSVAFEDEPAGQKPGLLGVLRDFFAPSGATRLPAIRDVVPTLALIEKIFGYDAARTDPGVGDQPAVETV